MKIVTITTQDQAIENIKQFNREVDSFFDNKNNLALEVLVKNIPHYRAWYCLYDEVNDSYLFAPSKYIGYSGINAQIYTEHNRNGLDGRQTESILSAWYEEVDSNNHNKHEKFKEQLWDFCAKFGKKPNSLFRINIPLNKPPKSTLEANVIEFIWNAYQNISDQGRKQVRAKINRSKN